jgi:hypothetical protein
MRASVPLVVHVVVTRAVHDQEASFELIRISDGRPIAVPVHVVLRQTHVPLLVDRVVAPLIRHRRHAHPGVIHDLTVPAKALGKDYSHVDHRHPTSAHFGGELAVLPHTDHGVVLELEDPLLSELTIVTNPTKAMLTRLLELGETRHGVLRW